MATVTELGQTALQGWREKVADGISLGPTFERRRRNPARDRCRQGARKCLGAVVADDEHRPIAMLDQRPRHASEQASAQP